MYVVAEFHSNGRQNGLVVPDGLQDDFRLVRHGLKAYLVSGQLGTFGSPENAERIRDYANAIRAFASEHGYQALVSLEHYQPFFGSR